MKNVHANYYTISLMRDDMSLSKSCKVVGVVHRIICEIGNRWCLLGHLYIKPNMRQLTYGCSHVTPWLSGHTI